MSTGEIEVVVQSVNVLNPCGPLPFQVEDKNTIGTGDDASTELRQRFRYLVLRHGQVHRNIKTRALIMGAARTALDNEGLLRKRTDCLVRCTLYLLDLLIPSLLLLLLLFFSFLFVTQ